MTAVSDVTVSDLVARAIDGDRRAWDDLVDRFTRLVWHVILGFRQLDAATQADIHQTTWLRLAERLDTIRDPDRLGSWLASTARNECIRLLRSADRETPTATIDLGAAEEPLDRHLLDSERDAHLWRAFGQLDDRSQALLRLLVADPPFTYDEISELLDMPRGSIGPTRQRCLASLRTLLEANDSGADL
jgi:RNA polymerase sigma factor (sigma-70 family)